MTIHAHHQVDLIIESKGRQRDSSTDKIKYWQSRLTVKTINLIILISHKTNFIAAYFVKNTNYLFYGYVCELNRPMVNLNSYILPIWSFKVTRWVVIMNQIYFQDGLIWIQFYFRFASTSPITRTIIVSGAAYLTIRILVHH